MRWPFCLYEQMQKCILTYFDRSGQQTLYYIMGSLFVMQVKQAFTLLNRPEFTRFCFF
jgi:hypothetical protein